MLSVCTPRGAHDERRGERQGLHRDADRDENESRNRDRRVTDMKVTERFIANLAPEGANAERAVDQRRAPSGLSPAP